MLCMSDHAKCVPEASVRPDPAENREIFKCTHLIYTVSGRSPNKQAYTCVRNAVTLVCGSLRFAPIMYPICLFLCCVTVNTSVCVQVFTVTLALFVDYSYIRSFMAALLFLMHHLRDVSFPQT